MAVYTYPVSTEHNIYPNLTVCDRLRDGVPVGYRLTPNEGYVFYNKNDNYTEFDEETETEIPVTYYYTIAYLTLNYNWDSFPYVAVLRSDVDEDYIHGGNNDHEVM